MFNKCATSGLHFAGTEDILGACDNEQKCAIQLLVGTKAILGAHDNVSHILFTAHSSGPWSVSFRKPAYLSLEQESNN